MFGRVITKDGVKSNPSKLESIQKFPQLIKQKTPFFWLSGYYRQFTPKFAKISKSVTKRLQKDTSFTFEQYCKNYFQVLKEALSSSPISIYLNFEVVTTDASSFAIDAILSQGSIDNDLPTAFASRESEVGGTSLTSQQETRGRDLDRKLVSVKENRLQLSSAEGEMGGCHRWRNENRSPTGVNCCLNTGVPIG